MHMTFHPTSNIFAATVGSRYQRLLRRWEYTQAPPNASPLKECCALFALMTRDVCCSSQSSVPCLKPSPKSASGIDAVILNSHRTCPTRCSMKPDPCRCLSPASRTFRQTDSDFVTRRTPASSAGCRRPESSRRPVSCCRTESWSERRRNRRRPERGPPEKPPSSPPETPSQNSRRSAAGRSPGNAPSVRLHPRSPALRRNRPVPRPAHVSAERTSPAGAASRPARSPSRSCSHPCRRVPTANAQKSASPYAVVSWVAACRFPEWRRSRLPTAPAWAASGAAAAGSPVALRSAASSALSLALRQTLSLLSVHSCSPPEPLAVSAHKSPLSTSLRCSTITAIGSTEPNQFRYPRSPLYRETRIRRSSFPPPQHPAYAAWCGLVLLRRLYSRGYSSNLPASVHCRPCRSLNWRSHTETAMACCRFPCRNNADLVSGAMAVWRFR